MVNHIRIVKREYRKTFFAREASKGSTYTLCGAPLTDLDILPSDAKNANSDGTLDVWCRCESCKNLFLTKEKE